MTIKIQVNKIYPEGKKKKKALQASKQAKVYSVRKPVVSAGKTLKRKFNNQYQ